MNDPVLYCKSSGKGNLTIKLIPIHPIHEENHVDLAAEPKPDQEFLQKPNEYFINLENVRQLFHDCVLLKKAQSFELEPQVAACVFPAIFVPQKNLCITGMWHFIQIKGDLIPESMYFQTYLQTYFLCCKSENT